MVERTTVSPAEGESIQNPLGEKAANAGEDVPMEVTLAVEPKAKSHSPVEEHEESLAPRRQRGRPATHVWPSPGSATYTVGCRGCDGRSYRHLAKCQKRTELGLTASSDHAAGDHCHDGCAHTNGRSAVASSSRTTNCAASLCRHRCNDARLQFSLWSRGTGGDKPVTSGQSLNHS